MASAHLSALPLKGLAGLARGTGKFLAWTVAAGSFERNAPKAAADMPPSVRPPASLSRRLFIQGGSLAAAATALTALDLAVGLRGMSGRSIPSYAVPTQGIATIDKELKAYCTKDGVNCSNIADQIIDAANRWAQSMKDSGQQVPDYVSSALAIKIIGLESSMNPDAQPKGGSYEGLAQFKPDGGKFPEVAQRVADYINANADIKARILATINAERLLKAQVAYETAKKLAAKKPHAAAKAHKPAKGKKASATTAQPIKLDFKPKTEVQAEDLSSPRISHDDTAELAREKVFHDVDVQIAALMFGMADAAGRLQQYPDFMKQLPLPYTHALLYILHNLPELALKAIIPHFNEETAAAELVKSLENAKKFPAYFRNNSGLYTKDGIATSREILHRVASLLQEPFKSFYKGDDKADAKYDLPAIPATCRSKRSLIGWMACKPS